MFTPHLEDILTLQGLKSAFEWIEIAKPNSEEKRPIALGAIRDKVVQYWLLEHLNPYFDQTFSDKSYAYRLERSHIRAIKRARDFIVHGIRVNHSVFEVTIKPSKFLLLKDHLESLIKPKEDSIRIYPLCQNCVMNIETLGEEIPPFKLVNTFI